MISCQTMRTIICISVFILIEPALTYDLSSCGRDADCKYEGLYCVKNKCNCKPSTRYEGKNDALGKAECVNVYAANCENNEDCSNMNNTICNQDKCVCAQGFKFNSLGNICNRVSKPGEFCESASNCVTIMGPLSECRENKCKCKPSHHLKDDVCIKTARLGEPCESDECNEIINKSNVLRCIERKCVCIENYSELNGKCNKIDEPEITETRTITSSKTEEVYSTTGHTTKSVTSEYIDKENAATKGSASSIEKTGTLIIFASYIIYLKL